MVLREGAARPRGRHHERAEVLGDRSQVVGCAATLDAVGNVAAFVASDKARTMTAADVNISCGAIMD